MNVLRFLPTWLKSSAPSSQESQGMEFSSTNWSLMQLQLCRNLAFRNSPSGKRHIKRYVYLIKLNNKNLHSTSTSYLHLCQLLKIQSVLYQRLTKAWIPFRIQQRSHFMLHFYKRSIISGRGKSEIKPTFIVVNCNEIHLPLTRNEWIESQMNDHLNVTEDHWWFLTWTIRILFFSKTEIRLMV